MPWKPAQGSRADLPQRPDDSTPAAPAPARSGRGRDGEAQPLLSQGTLTGTLLSEADMSPQNHGPPGLPAGDGAVPVLEGELALLQLHDEPGQVLWGPGGIKNTCQCWLCPEGGLADTRRRPKATPATGGSQAWGELGPVHRPRSSGLWSCALTASWAHTTASR